jgi:hypothetical protein
VQPFCWNPLRLSLFKPSALLSCKQTPSSMQAVCFPSAPVPLYCPASLLLSPSAKPSNPSYFKPSVASFRPFRASPSIEVRTPFQPSALPRHPCFSLCMVCDVCVCVCSAALQAFCCLLPLCVCVCVCAALQAFGVLLERLGGPLCTPRASGWPLEAVWVGPHAFGVLLGSGLAPRASGWALVWLLGRLPFRPAALS